MPTSPPSALASLSPPFAEERLARLTSTQALIDAVTAILTLSPLLPPLYIPPPIDREDDITETEMPPRKRLCLSTLGSRYKIGESSTVRPTGDPTETVPEIAPMTMREVNTKVTELTELHEDDTHDLYALLEDTQDSRTRISQQVAMDSQHVDLLMEDRTAYQETILIVEEEAYAMVETLRVMEDIRREMGDMQAKLLALREQPRRARHPREDTRVPDHQDAPRDADSHI
nr:hypothetical protein [Tanacetum cinerariifolium]